MSDIGVYLKSTSGYQLWHSVLAFEFGTRCEHQRPEMSYSTNGAVPKGGWFVDKSQQVLNLLDKTWRALEESYAGLTSEVEMLEPGVTGSWSVKDVIAHVTTWEEEALSICQSFSRAESHHAIP